MKVLLVIFGIALCVAISHYIDYKKTDRYYNSIADRSPQETERMKEFVKAIK